MPSTAVISQLAGVTRAQCSAIIAIVEGLRHTHIYIHPSHAAYQRNPPYLDLKAGSIHLLTGAISASPELSAPGGWHWVSQVDSGEGLSVCLKEQAAGHLDSEEGGACVSRAPQGLVAFVQHSILPVWRLGLLCMVSMGKQMSRGAKLLVWSLGRM